MAERRWKRLAEPAAWGLVWGPLLGITVLHYAAPHDAQWVHDVARRLFYLPIVFAALRAGLWGGLLVAAATWIVYTPHAFLMATHDPATTPQKLLEMAFYGILGGVVGAFAERLERTHAELRRKDAQLERVARLESLGELTAGLAHEIRNPLHAMRGTAEILLDFVPEGTEEHTLARAHLAEIDRLSSLLSRFLDFARHHDHDARPVPLGDIVDRVGELLRAQASQQRTSLTVQVHDDVRVHADFDQIVQVVLAVAINALQAVGEQGEVRVHAGADIRDGEPCGVVTVRNDGPPIPEDMQERMFDPFVSDREEGTGLGLASAWRIVRDHDGRIEAENVEGGVEFRIVLPAS